MITGFLQASKQCSVPSAVKREQSEKSKEQINAHFLGAQISGFGTPHELEPRQEVKSSKERFAVVVLLSLFVAATGNGNS